MKYKVPPYLVKWIIENFPAGVSRRIVDHYSKNGQLPAHVLVNGKKREVKKEYGLMMFQKAKSAVTECV